VEIAGGFGYTSYYVLGTPDKLDIEDEEDFDPDFKDNKVTTSRLTTAFTKFNNTKRNSRVLLNKFAKQIA
jgi:hypothetical protein